MGGAFIGVADDWTALYWNPAGLAQLTGSGINSSLEYLHARAHDSNGLANPVPPLASANILRGDAFVQLGGEPAQFNALDSSFGVPLPAIGYYKTWKGFTGAIGSYAPLGFAQETKDQSVPGYDVTFKSRGYILHHNISLSREVWHGVYLGAGTNLIQAHMERSADKTAPTEKYASSSSANGVGIQGVFGILARLNDRLRVGGVYRTGYDVTLHGRASLSDSLFPLTIPGLGTFQNEFSDYQQVLRDPTTFGVGLSFKLLPTLMLAADWQRTQWSASRVDVSFDTPGMSLQNQRLDPGWNSTSRYRLGLEWKPVKAWGVQLGYFRDPRAVSFETQSLTQLVDVDLRYYTAGFTYQRGSWRWSFGEQYAVGSEQLGSRKLRKEATSTAVSIGYLWGS
jgi:long-chain fatty acid transport protein